MPVVNLQRFLETGTESGKPSASSGGQEAVSVLERLYAGEIGEGGGEFGGRNNAIVKLAGSLRGKRIPYEVACAIVQQYNRDYLHPSLPDGDVSGILSRAWVDWLEGDTPDLEPRNVQVVERGDGNLLIINGDEVLECDTTLNWRMRGVLLDGGLHYLSGPPAGGKSWLALEMARCLSHGAKLFGSYECQKTNVLYVDEEMGDRMTAHRMDLLGFRPASNFYYLGKQGFHLGRVEHREQLLTFIREKQIGFVVFDTLRGCHPGLKENESEHVTRLRGYFGEFTRLGATLLVLHHDRKSGAGDGNTVEHERMAGSADFAGMADMAYAIDKSQGVYSLKVSKNRLVAEEEAVSVHYEMRPTDTRGLGLEVVSMRLKAEEHLENNKNQVLTLLRGGATMTPSAIGQRLGMNQTEVTNALASLRVEELANRDRNGGWAAQRMF